MNTKLGIAGASIQVEGILHPVASVESGAYWRLLLPGLHTITVTAAGYVPQTKRDVNITNSDPNNVRICEFFILNVSIDHSSMFFVISFCTLGIST